MAKSRLDILVVDKGLVESRAQAQRLIMAGQVRINDQLIVKPSVQVDNESIITIDMGRAFVSRGGEKLQAALEKFPVKVKDQICADVGASTGGFTDCLLQHGARKVYAIDVGYGLLHWKLRNDVRVIPVERTNARYLQGLPEPVSLITIDAAFISLKILLPVVKSWFSAEGGEVVALIKPQFESTRVEASRGKGAIRDPQIHKRVVEMISNFAQEEGFTNKGIIESPILGPKGNREFLIYLGYAGYI
jgi:23S rRNA (cytidine1920-2'-O)/16S rRNA (cytidine1409-2'-O)-methyltransferase